MNPEDGMPGAARGAATQTLGELRQRWGGPRDDLGAPEEIVIYGMEREIWRRVGMPSGKATVYELKRGA